MKMIELTCQKCGGVLNADIDNLFAYCPHCGQKLLFDLEQIEFVLAEREKTKREQEKTKREQEVTKRIQLEQEHKTKRIQSNQTQLLLFMAMFFVFALIVFTMTR